MLCYTTAEAKFLFTISMLFVSAVGRTKNPRRLFYALALLHRRKDASFSSCVKTNSDSLVVIWNNEKEAWSRFHYCWLRDNCQCVKCYDPTTGKRLLQTLENDQPDSRALNSHALCVRHTHLA